MFNAVHGDKLLRKYATPSVDLYALSINPAWEQSGNGTSNGHLVQHLLADWVAIFQFPYNKHLLSTSMSNELVQSTMLAISACHLHHVAPGVLHHQISNYFHQSQVVAGLRRLLIGSASSLGQSDADGLMLSATLLNMITFTIPDSPGSSSESAKFSWVLDPSNDCRPWLDLQVALRPILLSTAHYHEGAINLLAPIFFGVEDQNWEFKRMAQARQMIPARWVRFFGLDDLHPSQGCDSGAVFLDAIAILVQLRKLEPVPSNVYRNLQFLAKIQDGFRALLLQRDSKALWLLGYWLGLLRRFNNVWWCKERAERDYVAICMLLRQRHVAKHTRYQDQIWEEMLSHLESLSL